MSDLISRQAAYVAANTTSKIATDIADAVVRRWRE